MIEAGTILEGRYAVEEELGRGGFSVVYRVRHVGLLSTHAVKVLLPHLAEDAELRGRFLAEGRIQAQLRHPGIVAVTDIVTDPVAGLVMELVEGETLAARLERGPLPLAELGAVLLPVVDAVALAHRSGIVHRDLKPENILLATEGTGIRPLITDFGIAKVMEGSSLSGAHGRTRTGIRMGTLAYMSPEQVRGAKELGPASDVFALGTILYECATGRAAFDAESEFDTMRRIVDGHYEPPERLTTGLPPALAACIRRCLAVDPAERCADAGTLHAALRDALEGRPEPARSRPSAAPEVELASNEPGLPADFWVRVERSLPASVGTTMGVARFLNRDPARRNLAPADLWTADDVERLWGDRPDHIMGLRLSDPSDDAGAAVTPPTPVVPSPFVPAAPSHAASIAPASRPAVPPAAARSPDLAGVPPIWPPERSLTPDCWFCDAAGLGRERPLLFTARRGGHTRTAHVPRCGRCARAHQGPVGWALAGFFVGPIVAGAIVIAVTRNLEMAVSLAYVGAPVGLLVGAGWGGAVLRRTKPVEHFRAHPEVAVHLDAGWTLGRRA